MKLIVVLILLALAGAGIYYFTQMEGSSNTPAAKQDGNADDLPRVEEKYGFTTDTALP
jgi:flagellar basal body-associated protein FliL